MANVISLLNPFEIIAKPLRIGEISDDRLSTCLTYVRQIRPFLAFASEVSSAEPPPLGNH